MSVMFAVTCGKDSRFYIVIFEGFVYVLFFSEIFNIPLFVRILSMGNPFKHSKKFVYVCVSDVFLRYFV